MWSFTPNDHNEEYLDHLKGMILDIQIVHPTLPVIMPGDFNIVLEDRDSINRNANQNEVNYCIKDYFDLHTKIYFCELYIETLPPFDSKNMGMVVHQGVVH